MIAIRMKIKKNIVVVGETCEFKYAVNFLLLSILIIFIILCCTFCHNQIRLRKLFTFSFTHLCWLLVLEIRKQEKSWFWLNILSEKESVQKRNVKNTFGIELIIKSGTQNAWNSLNSWHLRNQVRYKIASNEFYFLLFINTTWSWLL